MLVANQTTFQQASRLWDVTEPVRVEPRWFDCKDALEKIETRIRE
jgi:hypothetical protein